MDLTRTVAHAETAARTSYGRLLAILVSASGDIAGSEDALADAFERALTTWPRDGVPVNPDGWLLTAARHRQRDGWKSAATRTSVPLDPVVHARMSFDDLDPDAIPDKRLQLMLMCAHPAIDPAVRTPLMLDVVLGCTAKQIAQAFALPTSTLAARLGRAKKRIRDAHIPFELPDQSVLPTRLDAVMAAVHGAFAIDWHTTGTELREGLTAEALHLAETLCALLPDDAEAHGLAALMYLSLARLPARYDDGVLVPLPEQDTTRWSEGLLSRGEDHMRVAHASASRGSPLGRFQLEAAIEAVHCARRRTDVTDWYHLGQLYSALQTLAPTLGGAVALAVVTAETDGPAAGLRMLDDASAATPFQPAWAARAHLLGRLGRVDDAVAAYSKAISLTPDAPSRAFLRRRLESLSPDEVPDTLT
jgi:predicted RNA polymerase sigma factor